VSVDFARCIPVLASLDIAEIRDFYVGWLGFAGGHDASPSEIRPLQVDALP
jgi:hypothetical protein